MTEMTLSILGCGSAKPTHRHHPSAQVLTVRSSHYIIDCGEGMQENYARMQLGYNGLSDIFISHLHGDHCFGLLGFLSTMALSKNKAGRITIHCHKDGIELFSPLLKYFCNDSPFEIVFKDVPYAHEIIHEDDRVIVTAIPLKHRVPTTGFLFEAKSNGRRHIIKEKAEALGIPSAYMRNLTLGRDYVTPSGVVIPNAELTTDPDPSVRYAYCSDTRPARKIIPMISGVDWLYHESTYADDNIQNAHDRFHSTARQAAQTALEAGVGTLLLGHYSSRYKDEQTLLSQAKEVFPNTFLTDELQQWHISN